MAQDKKTIAIVKEKPIIPPAAPTSTYATPTEVPMKPAPTPALSEAPPTAADPIATPSNHSDNSRLDIAPILPTRNLEAPALGPIPPLLQATLNPVQEQRIQSAKESYETYIEQADSTPDEIERLKEIWDREAGMQRRCSNCQGGDIGDKGARKPLPQCSDCRNGQHLCDEQCETGCSMGHYCRTECQTRDWPLHWHQHKHFTAPSSPSSSVSYSLAASPPKTIPAPLACTHCNLPAPKNGSLQQCSKCKKTQYCNKKCQLAHWPTHKSSCTAPDLQHFHLAVGAG